MLSILTAPTFPKTAIGIERLSVTAVALQNGGRGSYQIKQAATLDVPEGLVNPGFIDSNISNPTHFRSLLQEATEAAGLLGQKKWSVSLPSNTARSAILTLDGATTKGESDEVLDWKAEQIFGTPSDEMRLTRHKIAPDKEGRIRYFATAITLNVIDEYESVFESLGWKVGLILPRAVSETHWLNDNSQSGDSLLISSQFDGFTAILLRGGEPNVVRSVTCSENERHDEIYRLLMFYNDRFADQQQGIFLQNLLLVGNDLAASKIRAISNEALGRDLQILEPSQVGLNIPASDLNFEYLAAPAGLASFGC